jgi:hypothetical protein
MVCLCLGLDLGSREEGRLSVLIDHDILAFFWEGLFLGVCYYGGARHLLRHGMGWIGSGRRFACDCVDHPRVFGLWARQMRFLKINIENISFHGCIG